MLSIKGLIAYRITRPVINLVEKFRPGVRDALHFRKKERIRGRRLRREPHHRRAVFEEYIDWAFPELELLPGDIVLDLGANEGWAALVFGSTGAQVIGFEPNPDAYYHARERCAVYGNITIVNAAVVEKTGLATLFFPPNYRYAPQFFSEWVSTSKTNEAVSETECVSVFGVGLDDVLQTLPEVKFLKIDIEGGEMDLWETIEKEFKKIVFLSIEVHPDLVNGQGGFIARAKAFIREHHLESRWRLDWP